MTGRGAASAEYQYQLLRRRLDECYYASGDRLLETVISREQGVSRTPVRHALQRLTAEGFLHASPPGYVVRFSTAQEVVDLYDVRIPLEATAAGLTAERRSDLDLARLQHLHDEAGRADPGTREAAKRAFHQAVIDLSGNRPLIQMIDETLARIRLLDPTAAARPTPEDDRATQDEHGAVLRAIADRDPGAARAAQTAHLVRTRGKRIADLTAADPGYRFDDDRAGDPGP